MTDVGLILSAAVALAVPALVVRRWPSQCSQDVQSFLDVVVLPAGAGVLVGRITAILLDDPGALGRSGDLLVLRGGVEFWPGLAAATSLVVWSAHRSGRSPVVRLAEVVWLAMIGYGIWEAACLLRDGCFGPHSDLGLTPRGLDAPMVPVGLLMAAAIVAGAFAVRHLLQRGPQPVLALLLAAAVVSTVRALASFWLPKVGDGLTRQHRTSLVVSGVVNALLVVAVLRGRVLRRVTA